MLDPFLPEKPDEVAKLHAIQRDIHESFIELVKSRRGGKLDSRETALFPANIGLVDAGSGTGTGRHHRRSARRVARAFRREGPYAADRRARVLRAADARCDGALALSSLWGGANLAEDVIAALETRALWARYGL